MATQLQEPETIEEAQTEEAPRNFEAEARKMGWKPEEEFGEGDKRPKEFRDAETFVKLAEEDKGLQKQTINHLKEKIAFLERQQRRLMQSEQNAHKLAMEEVRREMREAVRTGDEEAFEALDKKADALRKDMGADTPDHGEDPTEHVLNFRDANPWYDKGGLASASEVEVEARLYADRLADRWIAQGKPATMPPSRFYAELAEEVNAKFPALKLKPARAKPQSDVAGVPQARGGARNAKTGANLPADAKATAERYVRMKVPGFSGKSKEEAYNIFAQSYQWES